MWQVATAKSKLSEPLNRAETEVLHRLQRRDRTLVVMTEAKRARVQANPKSTMIERIDLSGDRSPGREVSFDFGDV